MHDYIELIKRLKKDYDALLWYKKLFFPRNLKVVLEGFNDPTPSLLSVWPIYNVILNQTSIFQAVMGRFFTCLRPLFNVAHSIGAALGTHNLLNARSFDIFAVKRLTDVTVQNNFRILVNNGFNQQIIRVLYCMPDESFIIDPLVTGALAETYARIVIDHQNPISAMSCLAELYSTGLLHGEKKQAIFDMVNAHEDPILLVRKHYYLWFTWSRASKDICTQTNFITLTMHADILSHEATNTFWEKLYPLGITQRDIDQIIQICKQHNADPISAAQALEAYITTEEKRLDTGRVMEQLNEVREKARERLKKNHPIVLSLSRDEQIQRLEQQRNKAREALLRKIYPTTESTDRPTEPVMTPSRANNRLSFFSLLDHRSVSDIMVASPAMTPQ